MHQPVEDRIAQGRVADQRMPFVHRHLAGDQRRAVAVAVVQQFKHVAPLRSGKRRQAPVVQDQQVGLGIAGHEFGETAVAVSQAQLLHQARQAQVAHAVTVAAGLVSQRAGEPGFAYARWAADDQVQAVAQPLAAAQLQDQGLVQAAWAAVIDVFQAGVMAQSCQFQAAAQTRVFTFGQLAVDHQAEAFVEAQIIDIGRGVLLAQRLDHAVQAQGLQLVECRVGQHFGAPFSGQW